MDDTDHWKPKHECETCTAMFFSQSDAYQHMSAQSHWEKQYCRDCERHFDSEANLKAVCLKSFERS